MKLNSFKIFQKAVDTGSYSRAAEELGLTQLARRQSGNDRQFETGRG